MELTMDREKRKALANALAKEIKTQTDLNALSRALVKLTMETALTAERSEHLGDEKYGDSQLAHGNARNGTTPTRLQGQHGNVDILTPKDREGSVEPQWVRKNQTGLIRIDDQILTRYAKGLSPRDIVEAFQEMDDASL